LITEVASWVQEMAMPVGSHFLQLF